MATDNQWMSLINSALDIEHEALFYFFFSEENRDCHIKVEQEVAGIHYYSRNAVGDCSCIASSRYSLIAYEGA